MIQTTSPPAASRKWLRINGGRIRLPASCCWRIPPRMSQIESSTKPPPAVITQAISAAHFITPPLVRIHEQVLARERASSYREAVFVNHCPSALSLNRPLTRSASHRVFAGVYTHGLPNPGRRSPPLP